MNIAKEKYEVSPKTSHHYIQWLKQVPLFLHHNRKALSMIKRSNTTNSLPNLKFSENKEFEKELHHKVTEYFNSHGSNHYASTAVYIKAITVFVLYIFSYIMLVLYSSGFYQSFAWAVLLGFSFVQIGVNVQHDGSHRAYSKHQWVNKLMATTADFIGASSYFWSWKHNRFHHSFTNIYPYDSDINLSPLARITPYSTFHWFQRWQHLYIWFFYGLLVIKWQVFDDFYSLFRGKIGNHTVPRPKKTDLAIFILGKLLFFFYAFAIPLTIHPLSHVLFFYTVATFIAGLVLSMIFVLPHGVIESEFPLPNSTTNKIDSPKAIHMVRVTVDFMRYNPVVTSLVGGLNYHRAHHLFPGICHVHYSKITGIIDNVCEKFNVSHIEHKSYLAGLASHYHWLIRLGKPDITIQQKTVA